MKRDMDLIRAILLAVEESDGTWVPCDAAIKGYDARAIGYHAMRLIEAGLCEGLISKQIGKNPPPVRITRLTWNGHDFLKAAREPSRWEQARQLIFDKLGSASFQVWIGQLTLLMSKSLGLE